MTSIETDSKIGKGNYNFKASGHISVISPNGIYLKWLFISKGHINWGQRAILHKANKINKTFL